MAESDVILRLISSGRHTSSLVQTKSTQPDRKHREIECWKIFLDLQWKLRQKCAKNIHFTLLFLTSSHASNSKLLSLYLLLYFGPPTPPVLTLLPFLRLLFFRFRPVLAGIPECSFWTWTHRLQLKGLGLPQASISSPTLVKCCDSETSLRHNLFQEHSVVVPKHKILQLSKNELEFLQVVASSSWFFY